jgi:hypothetical protein
MDSITTNYSYQLHRSLTVVGNGLRIAQKMTQDVVQLLGVGQTRKMVLLK